MRIVDECPNAPIQSYLGMFTAQRHQWDILKIGVHMAGESDTFKIHKHCRHCGKFQVEHFVEHEELIRLGFSLEEIKVALRTEI